jgi:hypothetical protein
MSETLQIIDLLFRGPSGWLVLAITTVISSAATYFGAKHRFKNVREKTHALVGGEGKFKVQGETDVDDMFSIFDRYDERVQGLYEEFSHARGGAREDILAHMMKVGQQMIDECIELSKHNIAFRTSDGHARFMDRIDERFRRAKQLREWVAKTQQQPKERMRVR